MAWQEDLRSIWGDLGWGVHVWRCGCLVEGISCILCYTPQEIRVRSRHGVVAVSGCNLRILSLVESEVRIEGQVSCVAWQSYE